tara:strand:- start:2424 stop:2903 length:480 start_codon:yes stop_codon:yes gene_type:complete
MKLVFIISITSLLISQNQPKTNLTDNEGGYKDHARRIEAAVESGKISRDQASQRYRYLENRLRSNGVRGPRSNDISNHFKILGINDLGKIKENLLQNGIDELKLEAVLGGMIRVVHEMKKKQNKVFLNTRLTKYFKEDCGLNSDQVDYVRKICVEISTQ